MVRSVKRIDGDAFASGVRQVLSTPTNCANVNNIITSYNITRLVILDDHAPLKQIQLKGEQPNNGTQTKFMKPAENADSWNGDTSIQNSKLIGSCGRSNNYLL